jgi:hypothetical protein
MVVALMLSATFCCAVGSLLWMHSYFVSKSSCTIESEYFGLNNPFSSEPGFGGDSWKMHFGENKWMWLLPIPPDFSEDTGVIWALN